MTKEIEIMKLEQVNKNRRNFEVLKEISKEVENISNTLKYEFPFNNEEGPVVQPILPAKAIYNRFNDEEIKNMFHEKISKEIKEAFLSSVPASISSTEKQFTTEELIKHAQELKKKIEETQNNLDYNFNGELMNIETITNIIKFIKAHKPRFKFQLALKATGKLKEVRKILDVDIIDLGDYGKDGQIFIIPKEPPKYFTVRFE